LIKPRLGLAIDVAAVCQQYEVPAMAVAIFSDATIIDIAVNGLRANNTDEKVALDDLFHLGAASKLLTSYWAALLVESGQISWDTKVLEVFPNWQKTMLKTYHALSLSDLLSHRSKLPAYTAAKDLAKLPHFEGSPTDKRWEFAKWLLGQNPVRPQNDWGFVYSNAGYTVAAAMLEKVSENSWETAIQKDVALPLSLSIQLGWPTHNSVHQPHGHHTSHPFEVKLRPVTQANMFYVEDLIAPADNLSMSTKDFAQFLQLHLQGLRGQDNYLSSTSYQQLHQSLPKNSNGWTRLTHDSTSISTIDGSSGTFYTHASLYPAQNIGFLIFVNASNLNATKAVYSLRKKILASFISN
jgi:CubicO group peptidase (beta-lactamase class C family)